MLQVGVTPHVYGPDASVLPGDQPAGSIRNGHVVLNWIESRTHFAAWCIVSAPLIL
jgi:hypothetical protein